MSRILLLFIFLLPAALAMAQQAPQGQSEPAPESQDRDIEGPPTSTQAQASELPIRFKGDIRLRQQSEKIGSNDERLQSRLRLRLSAQAEIQPDLHTEMRLATSQSSRSHNQTLGDSGAPGGARRFIGFDLAYAEWAPTPLWTFAAGRFPQIHLRPGGSEILLDDDLAMEGLGITAVSDLPRHWKLFTNVGTTLIRENYDTVQSKDLADTGLHWGQVATRWAQPGNAVTIGAGLFNFTGIQGQKFAELSPGGRSNGNTELSPGVAKHSYRPIQTFIQLETSWGSADWMLFYERITNDEAADSHQAQLFGVGLSQGSWDFEIFSSRIESDAVPALFTQSDFCDGTTDCQGSQASARYHLSDSLSIKTSYYDNQLSMSRDKTRYRRVNLDFTAQF